MAAVLVLCLGGFVLTAGCHLLAIVGMLLSIPNSLAWVLLVQTFGTFLLALFTHPKGEFEGGSARLGLAASLQPMSSSFRVAYMALMAYSMLATFASAPPELQEHGEISMLDALDRPFFFTAVVLLFSTAALLASHSGALTRRNPFSAVTD